MLGQQSFKVTRETSFLVLLAICQNIEISTGNTDGFSFIYFGISLRLTVFLGYICISRKVLKNTDMTEL